MESILAFPELGLYRMLADFYPDGGTPQLAVKTLIVPGKSQNPARLVRDYSAKEAANLRVELVTDPPQPIAGTKTMLFFRVTPAGRAGSRIWECGDTCLPPATI